MALHNSFSGSPPSLFSVQEQSPIVLWMQFTSSYWQNNVRSLQSSIRQGQPTNLKQMGWWRDCTGPSRQLSPACATPIAIGHRRLPIIMLGLWASPHVDSGLSPQQLTFGTEIHLPVDLPSKEAEELDGAEFYKKLQRCKSSTGWWRGLCSTTSHQVCHFSAR